MQKNLKPTNQIKQSQENPDHAKKDQAKRALAEAQQRREQKSHDQLAPEKNGRDGPEATRFGDWEKNGIASDF